MHLERFYPGWILAVVHFLLFLRDLAGLHWRVTLALAALIEHLLVPQRLLSIFLRRGRDSGTLVLVTACDGDHRVILHLFDDDRLLGLINVLRRAAVLDRHRHLLLKIMLIRIVWRALALFFDNWLNLIRSSLARDLIATGGSSASTAAILLATLLTMDRLVDLLLDYFTDLVLHRAHTETELLLL